MIFCPRNESRERSAAHRGTGKFTRLKERLAIMSKTSFAAVLSGSIFLLAAMPALPAGAISLRSTETVMAAAPVSESLPAQYDMRKYGLTTHVQRQGSYGMCWSFASLASLESTLVRQQPDVDFSEWSLAYYTYSSVFGFPMEKEDAAPTDAFYQGGNFYLVSPMLTHWLGPVAEASCPFGDYTVLDPELSADALYEQAAYHVTDTDMILYDTEERVSDEMVASVKQSVYHGQAVTLSYYNYTSAYNAEHFSYYNVENKRDGGNYHAVSVVGWDDDFPASAFVTKPPENGAFLCKNSWGPGWGDGGYFWMSYAEPSIVELYTVRGEDAQKHTKQYQNDRYGFWTAMSVGEADTSDYMANVFTAEEDTVVTAVMFATAMPGDSYSIRVYKNLREGGSPTSGTASARTRGTVAQPGYHTVELEEPVFLSAGERFSVTVHLSGSAGQHIPCEAYTCFTETAPDGTTEEHKSMVTESAILTSLRAGESYYSADGKAWYDMADEDVTDESYTDADGAVHQIYGRVGHVCVRALAQEPGRVIYSDYAQNVRSGAEITLSCPGAEEIWYSFNGEDWGMYGLPVSIDEPTDLMAYAVMNGEKMPVQTQHYEIGTAAVSSMLRGDTNTYLEFEQISDTCFTAVCLPGDDPLTLCPISTASLESEDGVFASGERTAVTSGNAVTIRAAEPDLKTGTYVIYLTDVIRGNVNLDDAVNAADAADVLIYAAGRGAGDVTAYDDAWISRADWDQNQVVDAVDATLILQYAAAKGAG